jgi:hypothetical protein
MTALPSVPLRPSPKRWLARFGLVKRECGNCKSFDHASGQLTLSKIEHFDEVMRHVSPMQIGRADPVGVLEREREKISPRFVAIEIETTPLWSRRRAVQEQLASGGASMPEVETLQKMLAEVDAELAPFRAERETIVAEHPRLLKIEEEIDAIQNERRAHVASPAERWTNYGACNTHSRLYFCGDVCKEWS